LKNTTRTKVPFKLAQRNTTSRLDNVVIQDVRLYGRALSPQEVDRLARSAHAAALLGKPAGKRTPAETNELFDWWLAALDKPSQELSAKLGKLQQEEVAIRARGSVAHVAQQKPGD